MIHDLQQQVEDLRVRLLDLVEQQHAVRVLADGFRQQTALIEPDVARRRADQARHGVPLHVLRHVEAHELDAHRQRELACDLGLADAGGAREQERAHGPPVVAEPRPRHLDGGCERADRAILAEDHELQIALEVLQHVAVGRGHGLRRDARDLRDDVLDQLDVDDPRLRGLRLQPAVRSGLIDDVDGLVGQMPIVDVLGRQLGSRAQRLVGIRDVVVLLEAALQAAQDLHGLFHRRLGHVDLLEAARERMVLLEDAAELGIGSGTDAAQLAVGEQRLDEIRRIHDSTRCGAGADHGVDLVDEQNRARLLLQPRHHALQALLEVAAILRAGDQRAHVERVDRAIAQDLRHLALDDQARQALGQRGLADAGLADEQRIVLAPPTENLHGALDLGLPADQRIDLASLRERV